jgi:membrane protease YdiL (CAAX protease family)
LFRNFLFAPVTEEIVFRGIIVASLFSSYYTNQKEDRSYLSLAFLSTFFFGLAHLHHLFEKLRFGKESVFVAVLSTVIQFTYTSIFGMMAALFFIRTGNVYSSILSHIFCNYFGLPDLGFLYSSSDEKGRGNEYSVLYAHRQALLVLHGLGLVIFGFVFFPLTKGFLPDSYFFH